MVGRKLPGTSARFAPGGQGVVWGQTGIGPPRLTRAGSPKIGLNSDPADRSSL